MKNEQDYIKDITEIRTMMERSTRFLSLSGWAGIMAGIYALAGAFIAWNYFAFHPDKMVYSEASDPLMETLPSVITLAVFVLVLAISTAIVLSGRKARQKGEKVWNATAKRLLINMAVPLIAGGMLTVIVLLQGLIGLLAPLTLIFYGIALYNASKFTFEDVKVLGMIQAGLGLISAYFIEYGLLLWAAGFGVVHIIYGIYIHYRYER